MNCSVSGMTGIGETGSGNSGSFFSTDPQARDFMLGRFLPAAQAMATGSPHMTPRKTGTLGREPMRRIENGEPRQPLPLPYRSRANVVARYPPLRHTEGVESDEDDDDDDDYDDTRQLPMKGCGLLPKFCLKSSFCLMNPLPGVRVKGRRLRPVVKASSNHDSIAEVQHEQTWEAVYRHKLGHGVQMQGEDDSKLTTESYPITYWSNSQSPEGSSPYRPSNGGGISPYRNDASQSPFREGKGFLGVPPVCDGKIEKADSFGYCSKGSDRYWELRPRLSSKSGSGSCESPVVEKTLYVDPNYMPETPNSKSSSTDTKILVNSGDKDPETAVDSGRIEEKIVSEECEANKMQAEVLEVVGNDLPLMADRSNPLGKIEVPEEHGEDICVDNSEPTKLESRGKNSGKFPQALLPPPLPKSPSESWLWRTLPSVSSKNPTQAFLGIQFNSKKKPIQTSSADPIFEIMEKPSNVHSGQRHFSEVLTKPIKEE